MELPSCARMLHAKGLHLAFFAKVACPGGGAEYLRRSCNAFRELEEAHRIVFDDAIAELTDGRPDTGWSRWLLPVLRRPGIPDADACYALAGGAEAEDILYHPLLAKNLKAAARLLNWLGPERARTSLGDAGLARERESLAMLADAAPPETVCFRKALETLSPH